MSDLELNLVVVTECLSELAAKHQTAIDLFTGAGRSIGDIVSKIESSHGLVCWATSQALAGGEPRRSAGQAITRVSAELIEKLDRAATNYNNVDYLAGKTIGDVGTECTT